MNPTKWQLSHLAQSLTRAKRLEKHRGMYFKEIYETIIYSSARFDDGYTRHLSSATDIQAIRIIELKERYDKRVQQEYDRHVQWCELLEWANERDRLIMIRYFQKKKYVDPKVITRLLYRIEKRLNEEYRRIEMERNELAKEKYKEYRSDNIDKFIVTPSPDRMNKQQYLINGRFVYMTEEEYQEHLQQQAERIDRLTFMIGERSVAT